MHTDVNGLLRNLAEIRRAALAGEPVVISTPEGNLVLRAEGRAGTPLYGSPKDVILQSGDDLDPPALPDGAWRRRC